MEHVGKHVFALSRCRCIVALALAALKGCSDTSDESKVVESEVVAPTTAEGADQSAAPLAGRSDTRQRDSARKHRRPSAGRGRGEAARYGRAISGFCRRPGRLASNATLAPTAPCEGRFPIGCPSAECPASTPLGHSGGLVRHIRDGSLEQCGTPLTARGWYRYRRLACANPEGNGHVAKHLGSRRDHCGHCDRAQAPGRGLDAHGAPRSLAKNGSSYARLTGKTAGWVERRPRPQLRTLLERGTLEPLTVLAGMSG